MLCVLLLVVEIITTLDKFAADHLLGMVFEVMVCHRARICMDSSSAICRGEQ